jgi:hypothetical protein
MFRCRWQFDDGSEGFYLAEQVCHHPPISAFFYACPQHHLVINGHLAPKSVRSQHAKTTFFFPFSSSLFIRLLTFFPAYLPCCQLLISQKFYGNSVASLLEGSFRIILTDRPGEEYVVTFPNMYARGILIGTMVYEVSDPCKVTCAKHGFSAEIEFKSKVWKAFFFFFFFSFSIQTFFSSFLSCCCCFDFA